MEQYLAEIRMFGGNFAPRDWALCHGQILPINQNQALFSLLGTTYGGDGRTTFALPDLRGRVALHQGEIPGGDTVRIGQKSGEEYHTLSVDEIPSHTHLVEAFNGGDASGDTESPNGASPANTESTNLYRTDSNGTMGATSATGGSQGHENRMPYQAINYIICITNGQFPSRN